MLLSGSGFAGHSCAVLAMAPPSGDGGNGVQGTSPQGLSEEEERSGAPQRPLTPQEPTPTHTTAHDQYPLRYCKPSITSPASARNDVDQGGKTLQTYPV